MVYTHLLFRAIIQHSRHQQVPSVSGALTLKDSFDLYGWWLWQNDRCVELHQRLFTYHCSYIQSPFPLRSVAKCFTTKTMLNMCLQLVKVSLQPEPECIVTVRTAIQEDKAQRCECKVGRERMTLFLSAIRLPKAGGLLRHGLVKVIPFCVSGPAHICVYVVFKVALAPGV